SPDVFRDGRGVPGGPGERSGGIRRGGFGGGNIWNQPLHRRTARGAGRVDTGPAGNLSASGESFFGAVLVLSNLRFLGLSGEAGLARCRAAYGHSIGAVQYQLFADGHGAGGYDDRAVAILLHAGEFRGEAHWPQAISAGAG